MLRVKLSFALTVTTILSIYYKHPLHASRKTHTALLLLLTLFVPFSLSGVCVTWSLVPHH